MKNVVVELDKDKGKEKAKQYFMEICGHRISGNVSQKQIDYSLSTLSDIYDDIHLSAIFSQYEGGCVCNDQLICDGVAFQCRALSQVANSDILNVYMYVLTIGKVPFNDDERVLDQVYHDIWQIAFVDVGRDLLKEYISNLLPYPVFAISDAFGPGFFGMPSSDTKKFFQVLDAEKIGVKVEPSGLILPVKSYAGFFLVTTKEEALPAKDCENCISSGKTCSYCKTGRRREPAAELELKKGDTFSGYNQAFI